MTTGHYHFDAGGAECLVFTRKEGLLSAIAHDLQIRVTRFAIDVDVEARAVHAVFDSRSLRVVAAVEGGEPAPGVLTADHKREIQQNIAASVLDSKRHPEIRFQSTRVRENRRGYTVHGRLDLHGVERPIEVRVRHQQATYVAEATLHQPDFGIRPYTALLGTLKVHPDVVVRIVLPDPAAGAG